MTRFPLTEADLQAQVTSMCAQLGLYHYHPHDSRRSAAGWPDSVIISGRAGRIMFRELKTQAGKLTPEQRKVGYMLTACGLDWCVWRTNDLLDGTIATQLAALADPLKDMSA